MGWIEGTNLGLGIWGALTGSLGAYTGTTAWWRQRSKVTVRLVQVASSYAAFAPGPSNRWHYQVSVGTSSAPLAIESIDFEWLDYEGQSGDGGMAVVALSMLFGTAWLPGMPFAGLEEPQQQVIRGARLEPEALADFHFAVGPLRAGHALSAVVYATSGKTYRSNHVEIPSLDSRIWTIASDAWGNPPV